MSSKRPAAAPEPPLGHPVQVVVRRTGLSPDVLRVWERRHGAVSPSRSAGRQRLYTDADIARLSLLGQLTRRGHRIGELANLPEDELRLLIRQDAESQLEPERAAASSAQAEQLAEALDCIERLDAAGLERVLLRTAVTLGAERYLDGLVFPLLRRIGERWSLGEFRTPHEHLATTVVRQSLTECLARLPSRPDAPVALFTTPAGHHHELGALAAAIAGAGRGWRIVYLGADVPAEDIASAALECAARVVGLSVACDVDPAATAAQIQLVARSLSDGTTLVVGGHGVSALEKNLAALGVLLLKDMTSFQALLAELESSGTP